MQDQNQPDPSSLTDEELNKAIAGEEVGTEPDTPEPEALAEKEVESEEQPTETNPEDEPEVPVELPEDKGPQQPSRRESLRIQKLVAQLKQQPTPIPQQNPVNTLDYGQALEADEAVVRQLEADRTQYGQAQFSAGLEQANSVKFHTRLEVDAPKVEAKYPQLDKSSDKFNPALADAVNEMYLSSVGYDPSRDTVQNPNARYADYVEAIFELGGEIAGAKTETTRKNIAKQAATTGIRPDGSKAKRMNLNQAPQTMSDEELDAVIAQGIPAR